MTLMQDLDVAELKQLSELIYQKYQYDFRNYAISSFKRRVSRILEKKKLTLATLIEKLTDAPHFINEFVGELTVNVTEMFRDPRLWNVLRGQVIPQILRNHHRINIWHAGCSTGEEVVTMCVLLSEMGILENASIVATDIDQEVLERAMAHRYSMKHMELNEKNYRLSGGSGNLGRYYEEKNGYAVFRASLFGGVSYKRHDLVTGGVFGRFHLILCRNVMIYFNEILQNAVLKKFHESLLLDGFLSIGSKESLIWCQQANCFGAMHSDEKIYRKVKE